MLTDQWWVDAKTLAQPALAAVREGRTNFVPKNWEKTYFEWLENIQPWCVSRQLWWGHQIPAWYDPHGHVYVEESREDALRAAILRNEIENMLSDDEAESPSIRNCSAARRATSWFRTRTFSTPGSRPRSGRSRPWAGRTRRRS